MNISRFPSSLISLDEKGNPLVDSDGNKIYNGDVEKGRRLDIIIGLPASGKSSAIVDTISYEQHSMLIDNDEAKRQFTEFNKGWGANIVHEESQIVERAVFKEALREGRNIVLPKVGSDADKLMKNYIAYAKDAGYKVNVHFVDLDRNKALGRMMGRFIHDGRYLLPELIDKYANEREGNKIAQAYEALKSMDGIDGCSKWDNDVGRGEKPILVEAVNLEDDFIRNARKKGDMEYGEHEQSDRGSKDELRFSGNRVGDRGAAAQSGNGDKRADGRDGEHDTGRSVSVPEDDLRQVSGVSQPELFDENIPEVHEVSKSQQDDYAEVARTYQCLHMDEDENAFNVCLFKDDDGKKHFYIEDTAGCPLITGELPKETEFTPGTAVSLMNDDGSREFIVEEVRLPEMTEELMYKSRFKEELFPTALFVSEIREHGTSIHRYDCCDDFTAKAFGESIKDRNEEHTISIIRRRLYLKSVSIFENPYSQKGNQ